MKQNKIPRNEYIRKPVGKTNPYKHDVDYVSTMGYRDDSPFNDRPYIDIHTPSGMIDMSNTGIPLMANGMYLPPYSGMHQFEPGIVREQKIPMAQDGLENKVNKWLGEPMNKAQHASKGDKWFNPKTKKWERDDDVDNFRHPMAGRYTAEAIANKFPSWMQYTGIPQAAGFVGANALGIGHEITNPNQDPNYSWWDVVREAGEDIFNNAVGAGVGVLPMSDDKKTEMLWNLSKNNRLPDGYAKANMYFKAYGGDPSLPNIEGHYKTGGWLDAYDDEYRRGGQRRRRGTSKNIESSINDIFRRNYDVFGPAGKSRFNPRARYEEGGWLDKYQDAGQLRAASTTAAVPVSTQAPINPVNPESNMGIVDFVKHRWNTRDQGPSDWNLLMMDKTGSYVDSGVTPFDLMLAAPQQVIKTATKAAKNLPIEKAAKKVLGDRAVNQIKTDVKTVSDNVKESIKQYKKIKQYNKTYSQELKDLPDLYKQALQDLNTSEGVRRLKELGVDNMDDFMKFAESASKKGTPLATTGYGPSFDNAGKKITEPFVNINFEQIDELRKKIPLLKTKSAIDHEYGHLITDYLRSKGKTYKGVTDLDIEAVEKLTPHVTSNITDMLKKVQFKTPKKSVIKNITTPSDTELPYYFFKGSKGEEPLAHLRETKRNMLDAGIIDNIHQTITPELLKMFRAATGRKDRMLSFLQNTPEAYKTLASLLNKTPALIPIGLGVGAAANQKKMGGWLDKYNNF